MEADHSIQLRTNYWNGCNDVRLRQRRNGDRSGVVELVQGLVNIGTDIAHLAHIAALSTHRLYGYVFSSTVRDAERIKTTELGSQSAWRLARGADSDSSTSTSLSVS